MLNRYIFVWLIAFLVTAPISLMAQTWPALPPEGKFLSVADTIRLATYRYYESPPGLERIESRGNPAARPALYAILNDPDSRFHWPGVIRMLGHVGDGADGQKLVDFLRELPEGSVDYEVQAVLYALALLHQRKQEGADKLVDQVVRPAFWGQVHFRPTTRPAAVKGVLPFDLRMSQRAIAALARVDRAYAKAKAAEVQASIRDESEKTLYGKYVAAALKIP